MRAMGMEKWTHVRVSRNVREELRALSKLVALDMSATVAALVATGTHDPHTLAQLRAWKEAVTRGAT